MRIKKKFKDLSIIFIGLLGLIIVLLINSSINNDFICIFLMFLFLSIEVYGLYKIIRIRWGIYV